MHFSKFRDKKAISQGFSDCGSRNVKSTKNSPREKRKLRACIKSLMTRVKFGISERKVHFFKRLDG